MITIHRERTLLDKPKYHFRKLRWLNKSLRKIPWGEFKIDGCWIWTSPLLFVGFPRFLVYIGPNLVQFFRQTFGAHPGAYTRKFDILRFWTFAKPLKAHVWQEKSWIRPLTQKWNFWDCLKSGHILNRKFLVKKFVRFRNSKNF